MEKLESKLILINSLNELYEGGVDNTLLIFLHLKYKCSVVAQCAHNITIVVSYFLKRNYINIKLPGKDLVYK
jgi:hypothetical protein